jgi:hypothetical protein
LLWILGERKCGDLCFPKQQAWVWPSQYGYLLYFSNTILLCNSQSANFSLPFCSMSDFVLFFSLNFSCLPFLLPFSCHSTDPLWSYADAVSLSLFPLSWKWVPGTLYATSVQYVLECISSVFCFTGNLEFFSSFSLELQRRYKVLLSSNMPSWLLCNISYMSHCCSMINCLEFYPQLFLHQMR